MQRHDGLQNLPRNLAWPVVTVGTFDGVHVGHQVVLAETVRWARSRGGAAVAFVFEEPPRAVLEDENAALLTSMPHRLVLLERLGIDVAVVLEFTDELRETSALAFLRHALVGALGARGIVMGHGSAFGRGREGTEEFVRQHAAELGCEVLSVPAKRVDGEAVSSTRIRRAIAAGDFAAAAKLLGRPFSVYGTVVPGDGRGAALGFPTANLDLHHEILPPDGVYIAEALLGEQALPALVSVGTKPTFVEPHGGEKPPHVVEVYLIDFDGRLYGRDIEARFIERLRGQVRYAHVEELVSQMADDLARARAHFGL